ncbi:zinc finger protein 880 [Sinocyclocheilus anshuiensis]|uniref:zinc finger protein 880 n=1 Tax=Sinocyclocheilus anshuiensis TaxID=1608454 RepID=UPI0007BAC7DF|nr:PREDICTED: zinc finger protein 880-like [Sinocyclocheilus anshuiensis]
MSYCSFQAQLVSFMEIAAKAAEAEIKRRVEESCAVIRLELSRSRRDIEALKRKCVLMDSELRRARGRGRRTVWFKTPRDAAVPAIRDQDQNPDQTRSDQSVCSLEEGIRSPVIKQERQEQESGSGARGNRPFDHEQQNIQQIQAQENMENQKPLLGASEIQNTHSQTATERLSGLGLQLKAEKDDEEPRVHPRFAQLWTTVPETTAEDTERTFPTSRNTAVFSTGASRDNLHPVETQMELYEPEQINANDQMTSAVVDSVPAFSHGPPASVEKRFSCSYCEKSFSRFSQLKEHLRCHTGEKPFACAQCGRSFTKHCNLTRHAVVHSGEKPYQCGQCGKRFTQRSSLKCHQRTHSSAWDHS